MSDVKTEESVDQTSPEPSLSEMLNEVVDSVEMNEDGELEIQLRESDTDEKEDDGPPATEDAPDIEGVDTSAQKDDESEPQPQDDGWETRYRNLQSHKDKQLNEAYTLVQELREELAHTRGEQSALQGKKSDESSTGDDDDLAFGLLDGDMTKLNDFIQKRVEEGVAARIGDLDIEEVQDVLEDRALAYELDEVRAKHDDFDALAPQIRTVLTSIETPLSFEEAYQLVKANPQPVHPAPATPAQEQQQPAAVPAPEPQVDPEEVRRQRLEKAERLRRPQSANTDASINDRPGDAESIKDAISSAIEEAFSG